MVTGNLFANVPQQLANEEVEELLSAPNVRIERIVSIGHATAALFSLIRISDRRRLATRTREFRTHFEFS
jgi:hypothetical protein